MPIEGRRILSPLRLPVPPSCRYEQRATAQSNILSRSRAGTSKLDFQARRRRSRPSPHNATPIIANVAGSGA
jgi:hypothetical protein